MGDEWPSSPSTLVVNSPRRTLSLFRERRATVSISDPDEKASGFARHHGPKPTGVYGFVGSITTVIATVIYLLWAYTPAPWLHSLGITYYPQSTSRRRQLPVRRDEYSREWSVFVPSIKGEEHPIEPISDIGTNQINDLMFRQPSRSNFSFAFVRRRLFKSLH